MPKAEFETASGKNDACWIKLREQYDLWTASAA